MKSSVEKVPYGYLLSQCRDLLGLTDSELARLATAEADECLTLRHLRTLFQYLADGTDRGLEIAASTRQAETVSRLLANHRNNWNGGLEMLAREGELDQLVILCSKDGDEWLARAVTAYLYRSVPGFFPQVGIEAVEDAIQDAIVERLTGAGRGKTIAYLCRDSEPKSPHRVLALILQKTKWNLLEKFRLPDRSQVSLDTAGDEDHPGIQLADPAPSILEKMVQGIVAQDKKERLEIVLQALHGCMEELPPSYRSAILLIGMDFNRREIADALHEKVGAFDARLSRARQRLKELLLEALPPELTKPAGKRDNGQKG